MNLLAEQYLYALTIDITLHDVMVENSIFGVSQSSLSLRLSYKAKHFA